MKNKIVLFLVVVFALLGWSSVANATTPNKSYPKMPTNTDILASHLAAFGGHRWVILGGKLSYGGNTNAMLMSLDSPGLIWNKKLNANGFVRGVWSTPSGLYFVGDFTTFNGVSRNGAAMVDLNGKVTSWNPSPGKSKAITATYTGNVYIASGVKVSAFDPKSGAKRWTTSGQHGRVNAITLSSDGKSLYANGLTEWMVAGKLRKVVKMSTTNGVIDQKFVTYLRVDTNLDGYKGDEGLSFAWYGSKLVVGTGGGMRNVIWVMNPATGSVLEDKRWAYVYHDNPKTGTDFGSPPPYQNRMQRPSEGDVQALAVTGNTLYNGYHRNHGNGNLDWASKRHITKWNLTNGRIDSTWDLGLWGQCKNDTGSNCGVSSLTIDTVTKKIVVGGASQGYGDYRSVNAEPTGSAPPGISWPGLAIVNL